MKILYEFKTCFFFILVSKTLKNFFGRGMGYLADITYGINLSFLKTGGLDIQYKLWYMYITAMINCLLTDIAESSTVFHYFS